ncbi:YcnI family copper-binding membrane protein [Streptomyces sp. NBC_01435]|uniref:YcnI family copper-binding membrane protein n=1 Tax=Streptomyces sp. NBC_01435 TaxID=2903865 RepID=UPI002E36ED5D|nr:YcnI family protein [Streptomyces sp. NBC_01435]
MNVSRIALAGGVAASTVLILAGTASAHVSVQPQGEAAKGGYATVNFKVPNERDNAATTKVEVNFPTDHPLASVMPQAVPGWDIAVTKSKLAKPLEMHGQKINEAVSKVTWTATGDKDERGIRPGDFQQFPLSIGQLPEDADQLVFKAIQTYDNKEVVRWIEEPKEGAAEPESPAPVLALTAPATGEHGSAADAKSAGAEADKKTTVASAASSSDTTARVLGIVGIVIGVAGVAFGVLAGRRRAA